MGEFLYSNQEVIACFLTRRSWCRQNSHFLFSFYTTILLSTQKDWTKFWPLLVVGLFGSALPAFLYATAQTQIPSAIAGLLNALTPIFAFILSVMAFGKSFSWQQLLGITLGFAGTAIIFFSQNEVSGDFPLLMGFLLVLATFCYGISANTVSSFLRTIHPLIISTVSFVMIGPWMLIYLLQTDFITHINTHEHSHISLLALMTLSLVGTFGANIILSLIHI